MNKCPKCIDGLVHQGESIKKTCALCSGTGKANNMEEILSGVEGTPTPEPVVEVSSTNEESFLGDSGEASAPAPEDSEVPAE